MNQDLASITDTIYTSEDAAALTEELKADGTALWWKFSEALQGGIHIALGYKPGKEGATQYLHDHFPEGPVTPPREQQLEAVELFGTSMSNRALATLTGLSEGTIRNRKKELAETSGAKNYAPEDATVTGWDGKQYPASRPQPQREEVEAEIVLDDEPLQPAPSPASPSPDTPASERTASELGLDDYEIDFERPNHNVSSQTVREAIRTYAQTGSSGLSSAKKGATDLSMYLTSGLVSHDCWNQEELSEVAEDTADTVKVLSSLLRDMADATSARGIARRALVADDTMAHLQEAVSNLSLVRSVIEKDVTGQ